MATWVIGDVQGCSATLRRLVQRLRFDPAADRLWFVGDLVNRGPSSLSVLRWVRSLGDAATVVLGNHDLHLLARAAGVRRGRRDTLDDVLGAPDRDDLLAWLRSRPLLHREADVLLVHAGLLPSWTPEEAMARAREAAAALQGERGAAFLASLHDGEDLDDPAAERDPAGRLRRSAAALTRLRICTAGGRMRLSFTGAVDDIPRGYRPWFRIAGRRSAGVRIVCGHWALLGLVREPGITALDTGCVYGGSLTALRLEDGAIVQQECVDG